MNYIEKIVHNLSKVTQNKAIQESPADANKPARRESMPKIAPIRRENKLQTS